MKHCTQSALQDFLNLAHFSHQYYLCVEKVSWWGNKKTKHDNKYYIVPSKTNKIYKCNCKCQCTYLIYHPDIPMSLTDCAVTLLVLENTLLQSHLLWGEFSMFSAARANHYNSTLFVPPGTHCWWMDRDSLVCKVCLIYTCKINNALI